MAVPGYENQVGADRQPGSPGQAPGDGLGAGDHTADQNVGNGLHAVPEASPPSGNSAQAVSCKKKGERFYRRKRQGWDIHYGYILHLIGMEDAGIADALGITEAAVAKRRKQKWAFGRA